ncbi:MAG: cation transporter [Gemmatimonadetes bacterium]|nr:cation transporter [Gemmatimonadota bacterium]
MAHGERHAEERPGVWRYAGVSIGAAIITIALKGGAYRVTGSVGLLSDALESLVNLLAAIAALGALWLAAQPADEEHAYGHTKAEYLSSGFEGALVLAAAVSIGYAAVRRLIHPQPLVDVGIGLAVSAVASAVNFAVARVLFRAGRRFDSIALEADAQHLMTDVWTSLGVIVGVGTAALSGWMWLDPVVALAVAVNIIRIGVDLLRRSALGLLDTGLPTSDRRTIIGILEAERSAGVQFHALRTRQAGARRFVSFHILVPGDWSVQRGHDLLERIEARIRAAMPNTTVFTHLEPIEDPLSWEDTRLERRPSGEPRSRE